MTLLAEINEQPDVLARLFASTAQLAAVALLAHAWLPARRTTPGSQRSPER